MIMHTFTLNRLDSIILAHPFISYPKAHVPHLFISSIRDPIVTFIFLNFFLVTFALPLLENTNVLEASFLLEVDEVNFDHIDKLMYFMPAIFSSCS